MELQTPDVCAKCGREITVGTWPFCRGNPADHGPTAPKTAAFPFTTPHISGQPMVIESLHHLRQVERDYGVVLTAFSNNPSNWVDSVGSDLPRYRGEEMARRRRR